MKYEPFLTSRVPNLSLDNLIIKLNASGGKLNPNGGFRFEAEFILCKSRQEIRFSHTRIANQNHFEQIIILIIGFICPHLPLTQAFSKGKGENNEKVYTILNVFMFFSLKDSNGANLNL